MQCPNKTVPGFAETTINSLVGNSLTWVDKKSSCVNREHGTGTGPLQVKLEKHPEAEPCLLSVPPMVINPLYPQELALKMMHVRESLLSQVLTIAQ